MRIYQEEAGVISDFPVWVCIHENWLYIGNTLPELIEIINTEWENDLHLVG